VGNLRRLSIMYTRPMVFFYVRSESLAVPFRLEPRLAAAICRLVPETRASAASVAGFSKSCFSGAGQCVSFVSLWSATVAKWRAQSHGR
jgi:hypothetical protein